LNLKQFARRA